MGVKVAVTRVTCNTGVGNQDITISSLGGLTPKAAYFIVSYATSDGVAANSAMLGVGAATATDERWAVAASCRYNVGTTDTARRGISDGCVLIIDPATTATVDGEADFVSFITNGVRINWGNAPSSAYLLTVVLYAGTDVQAQALTFDWGALNTEIDINTVGFEPELLLTATDQWDLTDVARSEAKLNLGVVVNGASIFQGCQFFQSRDNQAACAVVSRITETYGSGAISTAGALTIGIEFGNFDSRGFSHWSRVAADTSNDTGVLALSFGGVVKVWADIINTPIATGIQSQNGPEFTPQFVQSVVTQMAAIDTAYTDGNAGSIGISTFDENSEYCTSIQDEDTADPTDNQSLSDDSAVNLPNDDASAGHVAVFVAFDDKDWRWNFTTTEGTAVKYLTFAIEQEAQAPTTTPSFVQSRNISILAYTPTIGSYTPRGIFEGELGINVNSYSHTIAVVGGYLNASFTIFDRLEKLEDWLFGLGRHIEIYNPSLQRIWEGFVNRVTLNVGGLSVVRGPLTQIANRVSVMYSSVDTATNPPTIGTRETTDEENDTTSQSKYGIIQKVLSVGGTTADEAEQIRDTWLSENAEPETSQQVNNQAQAQPSVTIECLGYVYWLDLFVYNQTASTGTINVSTQIQNVLAADLNSLFSTDYAGIETNTLQVNRYTNDDMKGWDYIKALTSRGDANSNRFTFGIFNDRKAVYAAQETALSYVQRLTDSKQRVETVAGLEIKPWNVQSGKWMQVTDFLIGRTQASNLRDDPRNIYIEQCTYSVPWSLQIVGGRVQKLGQRLAQLGLGGVG